MGTQTDVMPKYTGGYYVAQMTPAFTEPSVLEDERFKDIISCGNPHYPQSKNTSLIKEMEDAVLSAIANANDYLNENNIDRVDTQVQQKINEITARYLTDNYATEFHPEWTADEAGRFVNACVTYEDKVNNLEASEPYMAEMLTLYTCEQYTACTICDDDLQYQNIYYPSAKYTENDIKEFSASYFANNVEWRVQTEKPKSPENINGTLHYTFSENPREELAQQLNCNPEQLVMYERDERGKFKASPDNPKEKAAKADIDR